MGRLKMLRHWVAYLGLWTVLATIGREFVQQRNGTGIILVVVAVVCLVLTTVSIDVGDTEPQRQPVRRGPPAQ